MWKGDPYFQHFPNKEVPNELLLLMQEPILTRWKTCGAAAVFIDCFFAVLKGLRDLILKSSSYPVSSKIEQAASNFLSLSNKKEIVVDLAFYVDFNNLYFKKHFEFNRSIDKSIGSSGHISHHHLVRYFLKIQDLKNIEDELKFGLVQQENGTVDIPFNPLLDKFWKQLCKNTKNVLLTKKKLVLQGH